MNKRLTFWDHLDQLRGTLLRIVAVTLLCSILAFVFKDPVFSIVLAPGENEFITYRILDRLCSAYGVAFDRDFSIEMINTGLALQFMIHLKTAFCVGILAASPYILYQLYLFVVPALYRSERRFAVRIVVAGYAMFMAGVGLSYFIIFPMTFRFLGMYQVSDRVVNMISLESYMSVLVMLSLFMGIVSEMPVIAWMLGKAGLLKADHLRKYRRHAIVTILTVSAIITPTSDVFTLMIVSVPVWLLYETSILLVPNQINETAIPSPL